MKPIKIEDLYEEVMSDMMMFNRMVQLLRNPVIAQKASDIILNVAKGDLMLMFAAANCNESRIVDMVQAAMGFGMALGRLYGRSELMQELGMKPDEEKF